MHAQAKRWRPSTWFPGIAQLAPYPPGALQHDLVAGLAVAVVMIPSVLAYAGLIGVSPQIGLSAALGGMVGYALFASSRKVIVGPDTTIALVAASALAPLAGADVARTAALAAALAAMSGVLLIVASRFSLGRAADLLSQPVLVGYMNGAALILIATQLPAFLGIPLPRDIGLAWLMDLLSGFPRAHVPTLMLGLALTALLLVLRRRWPRVPAPLIAVVLAGVASFAAPTWGIAHLELANAGLPSPTLPQVSLGDLRELVPGAIALAFLIFAEGIVLAQALASRQGERLDADAELAALGTGNLGSAMLGGFCVGASGSRSIAADGAGGRTQLTQWVAIVLLVAFIAFLSPLLNHVPRVALAAILVAAAVGMVDIASTVRLAKLDRGALLQSLAVAAGVLVFGVLDGILLGIALALASVLLETARPRDAFLRRSPRDSRFHDLDDDEPGSTPPGVLVYRLYAPLIFANARHATERIRSAIAGSETPVRLVVLDLQAVSYIDVTAAQVLADLHHEIEGAGVDIRFARANRPLRSQLQRWLGDVPVGRERFFPSAHEAVEDYLAATAAAASTQVTAQEGQ